MYTEDEYLMLSGIQHFYFCKRQWALIHIEQQWAENARTMEGNLLHEKTDMPFLKEKRKDFLISRAVPVSSCTLGLSGICDVIEFQKAAQGIALPKQKGLWQPCVVEYKRGKEKCDERDIVQLTAQTMCLEETWSVPIHKAYLYYFHSNKRIEISIDDTLRQKVKMLSEQMHALYQQKYTPFAEEHKNCTICSLYHICMPRLTKRKASVDHYLYGGEE